MIVCGGGGRYMNMTYPPSSDLRTFKKSRHRCFSHKETICVPDLGQVLLFPMALAEHHDAEPSTLLLAILCPNNIAESFG